MGGVTLLEGWQEALPLPLRWGEVFPLRFLAKSGECATKAEDGQELLTVEPEVVVLSLPLSRHTKSNDLAVEMRELGHRLGHLLDALSERVALVVSTDLSHRYWANNTFGK